MRLSDFFYIRKSDRQILLALLVIIVVALVVLSYGGEDNPQVSSQYVDSVSVLPKEKERKIHRPYYDNQQKRSSERFYFDPNTADSTQLLRLGLPERVVRNIYKYRASGGVFRQKEDFARIYGLTVKDYRELSAYIRISSDYQLAADCIKVEKTYSRDTLRFPEKVQTPESIDLNAMDTASYKKVPGIGSYYARKIAEYGRRLGGFVSIDQLDEIEDFPSDSKQYFRIQSAETHKMRINNLSLNELKKHPYINYYQAKAIVDYRRLHGPIHDLNDLHLLRDFPEEAIARLRPYVVYQ